MTWPPLRWCAECDDYVHGCAHADAIAVPVAEPTEDRKLREEDRVGFAVFSGEAASDVACPHYPGSLIHDEKAPDAFTHPATYCPHCHVWIRHPAYPAQERGSHDATPPT